MITVSHVENSFRPTSNRNKFKLSFLTGAAADVGFAIRDRTDSWSDACSRSEKGSDAGVDIKLKLSLDVEFGIEIKNEW